MERILMFKITTDLPYHQARLEAWPLPITFPENNTARRQKSKSKFGINKHEPDAEICH